MRFKICFFLLMIFCSVQIKAQQISGQVTSEFGQNLSGVLILNTSTLERSVSDTDGYFTISARIGEELRFIKAPYERKTKIITANSEMLMVTLSPQVYEIEEVKVAPKLSGNLREDTRKVGDEKKLATLKNDLKTYIHQKTEPHILKPKSGEFVQPKGKGFETDKTGEKWEEIDLIVYLEKYFGYSYFQNLGLLKNEVYPFISYVIRDLEKFDILRFGRCTDKDLGQFQILAEDKITNFKKVK